MRHDKVVVIDLEVSSQQHVDIEGSRPPTDRSYALCLGLELAGKFEKLTRRSVGRNHGNGIEVGTLPVGTTDGQGLVDRRDDEPVVELPKTLRAPSEVVPAFTEIGTDSEKGSHVGLRDRCVARSVDHDARRCYVMGNRWAELANRNGDSLDSLVYEQRRRNGTPECLEQPE